MENQIQKCSNKNHNEIKEIKFCQICKVYLCNKCENFHSDLLENHIITNLDKNENEIFTGFCKEKDHFNKLKYFCKNHNQLCCAACITKIKGEGDGQHTDCNVCMIEDIKQEKKNKLKENIKYLEDLSLNFKEAIDKLKQIYEKINKDKEGIKLNILKIFTKIRNEVNDREDKIMNELDKLFDNIYFDESLIKKSEKITNQIKSNLEESKALDNNWEDNNKYISLIHNCINLENNIKYITEINTSVKKYNSMDFQVTFNYQSDNILNTIKNFGEIIQINKSIDNESFENILKSSKIIENEGQIKLLKEWLPYFDKGNLKCTLLYDAKRDGDNVAIFHKLCDNKGATLTLISTSDNKKIGGFLSKSFGGNKGFINDDNAFLFSLNYNEKYPSLNKGNNFEDNNSKGPTFGFYCIEIVDKCFSKKSYYHPYTCRYDFGKRNNNTYFYFTVIDLEIYQINH